MKILLSNSQAGPGRTVKQEKEEISHNHVQAFFPGSVHNSKWAPPRDYAQTCVKPFLPGFENNPQNVPLLSQKRAMAAYGATFS